MKMFSWEKRLLYFIEKCEKMLKFTDQRQPSVHTFSVLKNIISGFWLQPLSKNSVRTPNVETAARANKRMNERTSQYRVRKAYHIPAWRHLNTNQAKPKNHHVERLYLHDRREPPHKKKRTREMLRALATTCLCRIQRDFVCNSYWPNRELQEERTRRGIEKEEKKKKTKRNRSREENPSKKVK